MNFYVKSLISYAILASAMIAMLTVNNLKLRSDLEHAFPREELALDQIQKLELPPGPLMGNPQAPLQMVLFTNYTCPFCIESWPILEKVTAEHEGQISLKIVLLPDFSEPESLKTSALLMNGQEQGLFLPIHEWLMHKPNPSSADLNEFMDQLNLDASFRERCEPKHWRAAFLDNHMAAQEAGVAGTPTLFINGIKQPEINFATIHKTIAHLFKN